MSLLKTIKNKIVSTIHPTQIDDLKGVIVKRDGIAKVNRFAVVITPPRALGRLLNISVDSVLTSIATESFNPLKFVNDPRDIAILCEQITMPGRLIQTIDYSMYRNTGKVPTGYANEDFNASFILTSDYHVKRFFYEWQQKAVDPKTFLVGYDDDYKASMSIHQLDENGFPIYTVKVDKCWPTAINSISFDASADNTYARLPVTFTFNDMELGKGAGSLADSALRQLAAVFPRLV